MGGKNGHKTASDPVVTAIKELGETLGRKTDELGETLGRKTDELGETLGRKIGELENSLGGRLDAIVTNTGAHWRDLERRVTLLEERTRTER